jgi:hypothetical protein
MQRMLNFQAMVHSKRWEILRKMQEKKILEILGFEPRAFRMQSGRATTALYPPMVETN